MNRDPNTIKDKVDRETVLYQNGFNAGVEHQQPSRQTIQLIDGLKTEISNFKIFMDNITQMLNETRQEMKNGFFQNSVEHKEILEKKADKEVVDEIRADIRKVVWIILGGVIVAVLSLVVKQ